MLVWALASPMGSDADTSIIMKRYVSEKDACTSTKLKFLVKRVSKRQCPLLKPLARTADGFILEGARNVPSRTCPRHIVLDSL